MWFPQPESINQTTGFSMLQSRNRYCCTSIRNLYVSADFDALESCDDFFGHLVGKKARVTSSENTNVEIDQPLK